MKTNYTSTDGVKQEVAALIKKRVPSGSPVSDKEIRIAYKIVRANAIADTLFIKRQIITIEEV